MGCSVLMRNSSGRRGWRDGWDGGLCMYVSKVVWHDVRIYVSQSDLNIPGLAIVAIWITIYETMTNYD